MRSYCVKSCSILESNSILSSVFLRGHLPLRSYSIFNEPCCLHKKKKKTFQSVQSCFKKTRLLNSQNSWRVRSLPVSAEVPFLIHDGSKVSCQEWGQRQSSLPRPSLFIGHYGAAAIDVFILLVAHGDTGLSDDLLTSNWSYLKRIKTEKENQAWTGLCRANIKKQKRNGKISKGIHIHIHNLVHTDINIF